MPIASTYPGVYIQELSSGVHTITGVATSIAAFVGYTQSGIDNRPKQIFSFRDYDEFGGLAADSELSYAVQQFFQNGGTQAYVVRVPKNGSAVATVTLLDVNGSTKKPLVVTTLSNGTWSDELIVDVDYDGLTDSKSFNLTVTDLASGISETFNNVTMDNNSSRHVMAVINDVDNGSQLISVVADPTANRPLECGTVGGAFPSILPPAGFEPKNSYGLNINLDYPTTSKFQFVFLNAYETPPTSVVGVCRLLEKKISAVLQAAHPGASISCQPPGQTGTGLRVSALIPGAYDVAISFDDAGLTGGVLSADDWVKLIAQTSENVSHYWPNSRRGNPSAQVAATAAFAESNAIRGYDGTKLPQVNDLIDPAQVNGIYALEKVDLFNILCIPDASRATPGDPFSSGLDNYPADFNSIFSAALAYCQTRRAFLLIDPPPEVKDVDTATAWITTGLTVHDPNGNAAAYFPRLKLPDPLNNSQLRSFAPSGVVAGLYSRIDGARGVWKAPAGVESTLNGVQGLVYSLTDPENGALNPYGLNCFRNFPVYGPVSWGARTIAGADAAASQWKYIPVRRLALYLEESLYRGTKWVVFEPNDAPLWAQIRLNLGAFMQTLFIQGAFQGNTPQLAYFVKCDSETTTQNNINLGIVNIVVGFAPLKPAEFVVIKIQQIAGNIQA